MSHVRLPIHQVPFWSQRWPPLRHVDYFLTFSAVAWGIWLKTHLNCWLHPSLCTHAHLRQDVQLLIARAHTDAIHTVITCLASHCWQCSSASFPLNLETPHTLLASYFAHLQYVANSTLCAAQFTYHSADTVPIAVRSLVQNRALAARTTRLAQARTHDDYHLPSIYSTVGRSIADISDPR